MVAEGRAAAERVEAKTAAVTAAVVAGGGGDGGGGDGGGGRGRRRRWWWWRWRRRRGEKRREATGGGAMKESEAPGRTRGRGRPTPHCSCENGAGLEAIGSRESPAGSTKAVARWSVVAAGQAGGEAAPRRRGRAVLPTQAGGGDGGDSGGNRTGYRRSSTAKLGRIRRAPESATAARGRHMFGEDGADGEGGDRDWRDGRLEEGVEARSSRHLINWRDGCRWWSQEAKDDGGA